MIALVDNGISMFFSTFVCIKDKVNLIVLIQVAKLSRFIPKKNLLTRILTSLTVHFVCCQGSL